jgi:hypothetical protein
MITIWLLAAFALLTVAAAWLVAKGQARPVRNAGELLVALRPVDMQAFRNLTDPAEEAYLRRALPPSDFRHIQRLRLRAAAEYVSRLAYNASLLMRLGASARHHADSEVAKAAQEMMAGALELRLNAVLALCVLYARMMIPQTELRVSGVLDSHNRTRADMVRFSRLQAPTLVSRLEASF